MKLTLQQINYARGRINQAAATRTATAITALGKEPELQILRFADKYKLIASGKATLRAFSEINSYTDLGDAYVYPDHVKQRKAHDKKVAVHAEVVAKVTAKVEVEKQRLLDRLMLGIEGENILREIEKFASGK